MRGGQITLFFVVGMVLLFIVMIIYMMVSVSEDESEATLDTANVAMLSSTIGSCLDNTVNEELRLLGLGGGLVDFEGYPSAMVGEGTNQRRVLYGITMNRDTYGMLPFMYPPPLYPGIDVTIQKATKDPRTSVELASFQDGYFGDVNFPAVCSRDGPNKPGALFACKYYVGSPPGTTGPAAQKEFTERVAQRVQSCANLQEFSNAIGQKVTRVGEPYTNVTFTQANVIVYLNFPVQLEDGTTTVLDAFQREYPVRYLPITRFATDIARQETRNITFDISKDYWHVPSYKEGFVVSRAPVEVSPNPASYDPQLRREADLVVITDSRSNLDGLSYTFEFLIEHRLPMINPLTQTEAWDVDNAGFLNGLMVAADPDDRPIEIQKTVVDAAVVNITAFDGEDRDWQEFP